MFTLYNRLHNRWDELCKWAEPSGAWAVQPGRLWRHCVTARRLRGQWTMWLVWSNEYSKRFHQPVVQQAVKCILTLTVPAAARASPFLYRWSWCFCSVCAINFVRLCTEQIHDPLSLGVFTINQKRTVRPVNISYTDIVSMKYVVFIISKSSVWAVYV